MYFGVFARIRCILHFVNSKRLNSKHLSCHHRTTCVCMETEIGLEFQWTLFACRFILALLNFKFGLSKPDENIRNMIFIVERRTWWRKLSVLGFRFPVSLKLWAILQSKCCSFTVKLVQLCIKMKVALCQIFNLLQKGYLFHNLRDCLMTSHIDTFPWRDYIFGLKMINDSVETTGPGGKNIPTLGTLCLFRHHGFGFGSGFGYGPGLGSVSQFETVHF